MAKRSLLWIGDAVTQTGFARVTHNVCGRLAARQVDPWDVTVLGVNYNGDPHDYPYKIFPAILGGDMWGIGRVANLIKSQRPDVVVVNNDPWNIAPYLGVIGGAVPAVAYMPVDAPNQPAAKQLANLSRAVAYTNFGRKELMLGGYMGRCDVVPHGVDTSVYRPLEGGTAAAREKLQLSSKLPADAFIALNVNRNQPRKRLDLTIQYWTQWWINRGQPRNAYLYIHSANQDIGWNLLQLASYYGINQQFIITNPRMTTVHCLLEEHMPLVYNAADVGLSTTGGEGWGLTQHEGMACGLAQIVPKYSGLAEWCDGAVRFVDVSTYGATVNGINTIAGFPDRDGTIAALDELYDDREARRRYRELGLARATEPRFSWDAVAEQFHAILTEAALERAARPAGISLQPRDRPTSEAGEE